MVFGGLLLVKPSFSREKDGFFEGWLLKTIFFSRKRWFRTKKPSFSRENQKQKPKNTKKTIFSKTMGLGPPKDFFFVFFVFLVFSRKRWFFGSKPSFSRERDGFEQPSFEKPPFSREKDSFTRRRPPKTIFFSRKRWFRTKETIFFSRKPKKTSFGGPSPIVLEKMFFLFFFFVFLFFLVFWFWLVSCFVVFPLTWLGLGCHPRWVHWGGGVSIYIYIYMVPPQLSTPFLLVLCFVLFWHCLFLFCS